MPTVEEMKGMHSATCGALSSAPTAKDFDHRAHRQEAELLAPRPRSRWTPRAVQQPEEATYLHDIGKIAVADRVPPVRSAHRGGEGR